MAPCGAACPTFGNAALKQDWRTAAHFQIYITA